VTTISVEGRIMADILQVVEELQSLPSTGTRVPGFRRKVMVDVDRLMALGEELRSSVPADMLEAQEILKQRDSIVNQAYLESQRIKSLAEDEAASIKMAAEGEHRSKVDESEIVKAAEDIALGIKDQAMVEAQQITEDAQRSAYRIVSEAETSSDTRRTGADQYAHEVLFNLEERLADMLGQVRRGIDALNLNDVPQQQPATKVSA